MKKHNTMDKYSKLLSVAIGDKRLTLIDLNLINYLYSNGGSTEEKQMSVAMDLGFSRSFVNVSLKKLKSLGYISTRKLESTRVKKITLKEVANV